MSQEDPYKDKRDANGNYINWDLIKSMTEEEAAEMWCGLCETFAPHLLKNKPIDVVVEQHKNSIDLNSAID